MNALYKNDGRNPECCVSGFFVENKMNPETDQQHSSVLQLTLAKYQRLPLTRRAFLQRLVQLGAIMPVSSALHALWRETPALPAFDQLQCFSQHQARLLAMLAEILVEPAADWPTVVEAQVVEYIDAAMAAADRKARGDLRTLLGLFENRFVALLFDARFEALSAMTRQEQRDYLRDWMKSSLGRRRTGFMALKRLCTAAYYTHPRTWPNIGYGGPLIEASQEDAAGPGSGLANPHARRDRYDAIVIGSGAGGSVVAARLAQAGWNVAIIEKGGYVDRRQFNQSEREMFPAMYMKRGLMATDDLSFILLAGECAGGGTTINWGTSMELPEHVLADWRQQSRFADLTSETLMPYYEAVRQRLHIAPVPPSDHNANNGVLLEGAAKVGWPTKAIHRNAVSDGGLAAKFGIPACVQCGFCGLGCAYDAKQSALITYLVDATAAGAELFTHTAAKNIAVVSTGDKRVALVHRDDQGIEDEFVLSAPIVVIAGGALQSPALLLRSKLANGSGQVGRNLHLHPTTALVGHFDRLIEMGYGIPQSALCDVHLDQGDGYGFWVEVAPAQPGLAAIAIPEFGAIHRQLMSEYPHSSNIIILVRDSGSGRVELDDEGEVVVKYAMHERDRRSMVEGMKFAARLMHAAGALHLHSLHAEIVDADLSRGGNGKALAKFDAEIDRRGIEPNRFVLFSAHQMGTCRMGADPHTAVVNRFGECHEVKGLYVADGSIFPSAAGINPMLTIMALAEEISMHLIAMNELAHPALLGRG